MGLKPLIITNAEFFIVVTFYLWKHPLPRKSLMGIRTYNLVSAKSLSNLKKMPVVWLLLTSCQPKLNLNLWKLHVATKHPDILRISLTKDALHLTELQTKKVNVNAALSLFTTIRMATSTWITIQIYIIRGIHTFLRRPSSCPQQKSTKTWMFSYPVSQMLEWHPPRFPTLYLKWKTSIQLWTTNLFGIPFVIGFGSRAQQELNFGSCMFFLCGEF